MESDRSFAVIINSVEVFYFEHRLQFAATRSARSPDGHE